MIKELPVWAATIPRPMLYDTESATPLQQTARVYGAMNELIAEYNKFAEAANKQLSEFAENETEERKKFETQITKVMQEFNCCMNQRLSALPDTAKEILNAALTDGSITIKEVYDDATESLNYVIGGTV